MKQSISMYRRTCLVAAAAIGLAMARADAASVLLNGQYMHTSAPPIVRNGSTLVPMRDIFEALGASVQWNALTQGIAASRGATSISMQIGNRNALVNGQQVYLSQAPALYNGSTMVPLRFVSESMGANVDWNGTLQQVSISTNGSVGSGSQVAGVRQISIPSGVVVPVTLDNTLSSASSHRGDHFTTTVVSQTAGDSEFPPGTKIEGVVTEVQPKTGDKPGVIDVSFRRALLPDGSRVALQGSLTSLDNSSVDNSTPGRITAKSSSSNKLKMIGIGAGAGYVIGHLLLKQNGALSAILGAAGGYLLGGNKESTHDVTVNNGTKLGVRLDSGVTYADTSDYAARRANYIRM